MKEEHPYPNDEDLSEALKWYGGFLWSIIKPILIVAKWLLIVISCIGLCCLFWFLIGTYPLQIMAIGVILLVLNQV